MPDTHTDTQTRTSACAAMNTKGHFNLAFPCCDIVALAYQFSSSSVPATVSVFISSQNEHVEKKTTTAAAKALNAAVSTLQAEAPTVWDLEAARPCRGICLWMCVCLQIYAGELQCMMLQDGKSFAKAPLGLIQTHFIIRRKRTRFKYSSDVKLSGSRDLWKTCFEMCPISHLDSRDSKCVSAKFWQWSKT